MKPPLAMGLILLGAATTLSACNIACSASSNKLAALKRGMSYDEVSRVMGCAGDVVTGAAPDRSDYAIVEWGGPLILSRRTRMQFLNDQLIGYTTEPRGALEALTQPPP
jgi:hypothetical protein